MNSKNTKGFTLIEVMIVVAIVAIIAAIALPSYQSSMQKSRRTDGKSALVEIAALQEKYYFRNNLYNDSLTDLYGGAISREGYYDLVVNTDAGNTGCGADGECFKLTATPRAAQADDTSCATYTLNQAGLRTALDSGGTDNTSVCW